MDTIKLNLFIVLTLSVTGLIYAQSANLVGVAGDNYSNTNYQLNWSIGETLTETYQNGTNVLSQGFHQNTYSVVSVENNSNIDLRVYPNPTTDLIMVDFNQYENASYVLTIIDLNGKVLHSKKLNSNKVLLNFATYVSGTYSLLVKQQNKLIKSFKIIKK
jgi:hypothetical protein